MRPSVGKICEALVRSRLLSQDEVVALVRHWKRAADDPNDLDGFTQWLVARRHATEYQVEFLLDGRVEGFVVGPYKILDRAGKGRMASLFKAVHEEGLLVTLKVLSAHSGDEARIARGLDHPNVVRTMEVGDEGESRYLAMEYLPGRTLEELLQRRGRLAPFQAVGLIQQALQGLEYLHERGVVHGCVEAGTLMVVPTPGLDQVSDPGQVTVKLLEFGRAGPLTEDGVRADIQDLGRVLSQALGGPNQSQGSQLPGGFAEVLDRMLAGQFRTATEAADALAAFEQRTTDDPPPEDHDWLQPPPELPPDAFADLTSEPSSEAPQAKRQPTARVSRRECVALVLGACGLLIAELIGWLLARWWRPP